MTDIIEQIARVEKALDEIRYARRDPTCPEYLAFTLLQEYAAELRARTPAEINRVLAAMTDQVDRARRHKAQHGHLDLGHAQTITEALCGRWWPTIEKALKETRS